MKKLFLSPIWSLLVLGALAWLYSANPNLIESLRLRFFDQLIVQQDIVDNNIYAVNIDEETIKKYGQWPFPRNDYAELITNLYDRGAGLVIFNVLMSEYDRAEKDFELAKVMEKFPVIVTMLGTEKNKNEPINPGATIVNSDFLYLIPSVLVLLQIYLL